MNDSSVKTKIVLIMFKFVLRFLLFCQQSCQIEIKGQVRYFTLKALF